MTTQAMSDAAELAAMLGMVNNVALLEEIATDLDMPVGNVDPARGDLRMMYRVIVSWINSDQFDAMEDNGMAFVLAAKDKLRMRLGFSAPDPDDNDVDLVGSLGARVRPKTEPKVRTNEEEESEDESSGSDDSREGLGSGRRNQPHFPAFAGPGGVGHFGYGGPVGAELQPRKELKLSGTIGKPGEKGKLTLSSLKCQIRMAQDRHYRDSEICAAVIRIMSPSLDLRRYFEEQRRLTVRDLLFHLEAHYQKQDAKILFNQLGAAVMAEGQTAAQFAYQLMGERDRLANLPKRERGAYTKKLIQEQFQHALYTSMRNQAARRELKHLLCGNVVPTDNQNQV